MQDVFHARTYEPTVSLNTYYVPNTMLTWGTFQKVCPPNFQSVLPLKSLKKTAQSRQEPILGTSRREDKSCFQHESPFRFSWCLGMWSFLRRESYRQTFGKSWIQIMETVTWWDQTLRSLVRLQSSEQGKYFKGFPEPCTYRKSHINWFKIRCLQTTRRWASGNERERKKSLAKRTPYVGTRSDQQLWRRGNPHGREEPPHITHHGQRVGTKPSLSHMPCTSTAPTSCRLFF